MAKSKTQEYIDELKTFVKHRNDGAFDPWLMPILRATAMNMVILDKLQDELEKGNMTDITDGSMGQQKTQVNPLLDKYDKMQNTLIKQFEKLGLTASNKDSCGNADTDDEDPVLAVLSKR
jgi:hypothetical protein